MTSVSIVDYGAGNIGSLVNMIKKVGGQVALAKTPDDILRAQKLILPGVGSFDFGMKQLDRSGLIPALNEHALGAKKPILGICLGLQLMTQSSEEGVLPGLGWISGRTVKFDSTRLPSDYKIPHMGWNYCQVKADSVFFEPTVPVRFYFVHSYHLAEIAPETQLLETEYGYSFTSGILKENIVGVQFHPEKSHIYGKQLIRRFLEGA